MNDEDNARPDDDGPDDPSSEESTRDDNNTNTCFSLRLSEGVARSLRPGIDAATHSVTASLKARFHKQMQGLVKTAMPNVTYPMPEILPWTPNILDNLIQRWSKNILGDLRKSLGPVLDPEVLRGFPRRLLPPNLRDHADEVSADQVYDFLQEEGVPLYLVPRGPIAVRLLRAADHQARRKALSDRYEALIEDCEAVLAQSDHPAVRDEVQFTRDGIGAMRAGYTRPAQAMFTVTLDTLIHRFFPSAAPAPRSPTTRRGRRTRPHRLDGRASGVRLAADLERSRGILEPQGDQVPRHSSRHASVPVSASGSSASAIASNP